MTPGSPPACCPSSGASRSAEHEAAEELVLFDDADERLAAAVADGARIEARSTERIGDRRVTRALVVNPKAVTVRPGANGPRCCGGHLETLAMVGVAMLVTIPFGLLLGVLLLLTDRGGLLESRSPTASSAPVVNVAARCPSSSCSWP